MLIQLLLDSSSRHGKVMGQVARVLSDWVSKAELTFGGIVAGQRSECWCSSTMSVLDTWSLIGHGVDLIQRRSDLTYATLSCAVNRKVPPLMTLRHCCPELLAAAEIMMKKPRAAE